LQAHHVQPYSEHPERRWDISNGLTVCAPCHWQIHATTENAVNSGKPVTGGADGNPEPSYGRKPVEGATTRGRAYRRWNGNCEFCGVFISRRWSDTKGKAHLFCSKTCSGKFRAGQPQFPLRRPRQ
jgi:5-methylcytosine-specific restriction endonuclease McrA